MKMLIECIESGGAFITYGSIAAELEQQFEIPKIAPIHIGHVAGNMMNRLLDVAPDAPLINALVTRPGGLPGNGAGQYLADRYKKKKYSDWDSLPKREKIAVIDTERQKIFRYKKWRELFQKAFGPLSETSLVDREGTEEDGKPPQTGGRAGGESPEHEKLKTWVSENPTEIKVASRFGNGKIEVGLLSGDKVDVVFSDGCEFVMVEVKSQLSNDVDLLRGIFQCVKYREIRKAEHAPYQAKVRAILVTEKELPSPLKKRAEILQVEHHVVRELR